MLRNVGEMKQRITLQRGKGGTDNKGYPVVEWQDVAQVWAYREDVSSKEFFGAAAAQLEETVSFTIHQRRDVDNAMRILHRGVPYEILSISGGRNLGDLLVIRTKRIEKEKVNVQGQL